MNSKFGKTQILAAITAVGIVAGAIAGLGSYSNTKFAVVAAAAHQPAAAIVQLAIEPSRIDVIATRGVRSRTVAQVTETGPGKSL